jgi:hypothetical protein
VVGSPIDYNAFSITRRDGIPPGWSSTTVETQNFLVSGMFYSGSAPTPIRVERASLDRLNRLNIIVSAPDTATVTAKIDDLAPPVTLIKDGKGHFYGSYVMSNSFTLNNSTPPKITISASNSGNSNATASAIVTDEVLVQSAKFTPPGSASAEGSLVVIADTSTAADQLSIPGIPAVFGADKQATVNMKVPPAAVTVVSKKGGQSTQPVLITEVSPLNDSAPSGGGSGDTPSNASLVNDSNLVATIGTPTLLTVFANDGPVDPTTVTATPPLVAPDATTVAPANSPSAGSIGVIGVQGIRFDPKPGFTGYATFTYSAPGMTAATVFVQVTAEHITYTAECRTSKNQWRIDGTTDAAVANTISAYVGTTVPATGQSLGSAPVDAVGAFSVRFTSACTNRISLKSAKGTTVNNIDFVTRR